MANRETALAFGPEGTLIGVLTEPGTSRPGAAGDVACLLLNVGINHRVGPRRINVKAARQLADAGIASLRFDLSGVGDSRASGGSENFRAQALADMRAALDQLQSATGATRFLLFGICSGAANALILALGDTRVIGLVMLDGYIFPSKGVRIERKLRRWAAFPFNPALRSNYAGWMDWVAWARAPGDAQARGKALGRLLGRASPTSTEDTGLYQANAPDYAAPDFARDINALVARHVDVYMMYSVTINTVDHDRDLMRDLRREPFMSKVRYKFWPEVDHTVTSLAAQRELLGEVCRWAQAIVQPQQDAAPAPLRREAPPLHAGGAEMAGTSAAQ
ncbi:MAG: alpha/beta hydrolase [Proteobacteria bacterium]|nr:alpha/beta hydrolase [Pseudomonadota bacterium]